ncbi:MAG TPA: hypothetical protein VNH53_06365 [Sphingomicrobium sp.]|jgi:hypothetical protein|nr:hypothetical protein [Sphingomicrobium sp.]
MRSARSVIALDPRLFGRRQSFVLDESPQPSMALGEDARLFATTFAAGFLFVFLLIA